MSNSIRLTAPNLAATAWPFPADAMAALAPAEREWLRSSGVLTEHATRSLPLPRVPSSLDDLLAQIREAAEAQQAAIEEKRVTMEDAAWFVRHLAVAFTAEVIAAAHGGYDVRGSVLDVLAMDLVRDLRKGRVYREDAADWRLLAVSERSTPHAAALACLDTLQQACDRMLVPSHLRVVVARVSRVSSESEDYTAVYATLTLGRVPARIVMLRTEV